MPIKLKVDNRSAIELAKNPTFHYRSKHVDVCYNCKCTCAKESVVELKHVVVRQ